MKKYVSKLSPLRWRATVVKHALEEKMVCKTACLALFDPSISSDNMGDSIISEFGTKVLGELFPGESIFHLPTHVMPGDEEISELPKFRHKIVCGTNLMTPHIENYSMWIFPRDLRGVTGSKTLAVGWEYYCPDISKASRTTYRYLLSRTGWHSVRDRYTEQKFREMGIHNVLYTGCVTLWEMTPEKCAKIPTRKARNVITTITDYSRYPEKDELMFRILAEHYEKVYVWIQGVRDIEYLASITDLSKLHIVERSVEAFRSILRQGNIDYIGTRLHAGIFAMNYCIRSIIIAIDNRAKEMGKDVNLVMVDRESLEEKLPYMIDDDFNTKLDIPWDNINKWKSQFTDRSAD